jgi:hypothetical protein
MWPWEWTLETAVKKHKPWIKEGLEMTGRGYRILPGIQQLCRHFAKRARPGIIDEVPAGFPSLGEERSERGAAFHY